MAGVSAGELSLFFRRLHTMLDAGVSLPDSLAYLEKGETDPEVHAMIEGCLQAILRGQPLSVGMRKFPKAFRPMMVEMVVSGESTGSLANTLNHLARLSERHQARRQNLKSALAYPFCLFIVMILVALLFVTFVAPGDDGLFGVLGDDVPWPSQVLIALSKFLTNPLLLGALLIVVIGVFALLRKSYRENPSFQRFIDESVLATPILGRLIVRLEAARVLEILGSSLRIGLSVVVALKNAAGVCTNTKFREDLEQAIEAISTGCGIGASLAEHTSIPRYATSLIEVAEESGQLDHVIDRAALCLDDEANSALAQLVTLAEPLLLSLGGAAAGFIAVATFLPIMRLVSNL